MRRAAIVGLGMVTNPGPGKSVKLLEAEAARLAIEAAGLERKDITAAIRPFRHGGLGSEYPSTDAFPRILGLPVNLYYMVGRGTQTGHTLVQAWAYLEQGLADYVLIVSGTNAFARSRIAQTPGTQGAFVGVRTIGYFGPEFGDVQPVSHHSFLAARHMHEFGTTAEQLGSVAVQTRAWAQMNPAARFFGRPMTLDDYMNAPLTVEPYRLFDMSVNSDGAVAFIVTLEDRARDSKAPPVWVLGTGFGEMMASDWWDHSNYTRLPVRTAKEHAFRQAGITLADIDCAMLYDCFTGEVILQLEDYGWCAKGEGGPFAEAGNIGPGGSIPVNTGGGLLSSYHFSDFTGLSEAVLQLSGRAGARQLPSCELALVAGHGGEVISPGMCSSHATTVLAADR